ncbi:MAG TPA: hypothetical protein VJ724_09480 [Tahibacter sp.]|nr:hypothetical protein [Tahibacter sp.]
MAETSDARRIVVELAPVAFPRRDRDVVSYDAVAVGPDRAIYVASRVGLARLFSRRPPYTYRVLAFADGECTLDVTIAGLPFVVHHVQPLGEHLLLASARCMRRSDGHVDRNARVHARSGELVREFTLGDGLEDVQTTKDGQIWTSYFDEGVLGNPGYGWRDPVGAAGLVAWSDDGERRYAYEPPAGVDPVVDCYALNVAAKDDVWLCYYGEFPLVRLRHRQPVAWWPAPVEGSRAFAVDGRHVLFGEGSHGVCDYALYALGQNGETSHLATFAPQGPDGETLAAERLVARADALVIENRGRFYTLGIDDALAHVTR